MNKTTWFLTLLLAAALAWQPLLAQPSALQQVQVDVVYLASDYLEGRGAGTEGEAKAAAYIAWRLGQLGLTPKGTDGWYQDFSFQYRAGPHGGGEPVQKKARNVVGYIDNGAPHTVVIGAHYDHLGYGDIGSRHTGERAVHNGADDNASGVAALLAIAERLKGSPHRANNYLFIAFSGEEYGLHGSKYFVKNPTIPQGTINYMVNMDMVGRLNEEKVLLVGGVGTSPVWPDLVAAIDVHGIKAKTSASGMGASDHASFYLEDIPVLSFFTGQHQDYHTPVDDAHLINYEGLAAVVDYIVAAVAAADAKGRLAFTKTKEEEGRQAARFKVGLGVMPDYAYDGEGVRIDGVVDGRAGQKAGIAKGDVIVGMGGKAIKDVYEYMEGLSKFNPGDKTTVTVRRDGKEVALEVAF